MFKVIFFSNQFRHLRGLTQQKFISCPLCLFITSQQMVCPSETIRDHLEAQQGLHLNMFAHNHCGLRKGLWLIAHWLLTAASYSLSLAQAGQVDVMNFRVGGKCSLSQHVQGKLEHLETAVTNENHTDLCCAARSLSPFKSCWYQRNQLLSHLKIWKLTFAFRQLGWWILFLTRFQIIFTWS